MQKREDFPYKIEFSPFSGALQTHRLIWDYNEPELLPIDSLHHHDAGEVGYCFSGSGVFFIDGENLPFTAPCATVIYPGQLHKARSVGEEKSRWIFMTLPAEGIVPVQAKYGLVKEEGLVSLARETAEELSLRREQYEACALSLLSAILLRHGRNPKESVSPSRQDALLKLSGAVRLIDETYAQELTVTSLSEKLFVHPSTLRNWFSEAFGCGVLEYIHRVRLSAACALLRSTGHKICDIAASVGYASLSAFNRQFQKEYGISPRKYRETVF